MITATQELNSLGVKNLWTDMSPERFREFVKGRAEYRRSMRFDQLTLMEPGQHATLEAGKALDASIQMEEVLGKRFRRTSAGKGQEGLVRVTRVA